MTPLGHHADQGKAIRIHPSGDVRVVIRHGDPERVNLGSPPTPRSTLTDARMAAVLVELEDGRGLRSAADALTEGPNDLPYFVTAAQIAAAQSEHIERFVISYSPNAGRTLTERDAWLLVGDERATPLPGRPRCRVFRTYGERFRVPQRGWREPSLTVAEVAQYARNELRATWKSWPDLAPRRGRRAPEWLPLGAPAFRSVPSSVPAIDQRPIDVSFRGGVRAGKRYSPKRISRQRMVAALARIPSATLVDFQDTGSFLASYSRDPRAYTEALLRTKICLAPRGGSVETFRAFEGALAGCVVVTEPLPPAWFYGGLPRIELRSWSGLPDAVEQLLREPALMRSISAGAREWALSVVSPEAIGQWIALRLKDGSE